ncbi:MAG TPA: hypothetical protein VF246_03435 [Acidimicrobiia bacterium]
MTLRNVLLFFHIAAAGTWLGANMVQMAVARIGRSEGSSFAAGWMRVGAKLGGRLYMPAGLVLLGTGVPLVLDGPYDFENLFVTIGFTVVIIGAVLGMAVLTPAGFKAADAIERGDEAGTRAATARLAGVATLDTLLVLVAIFGMVAKLGA